MKLQLAIGLVFLCALPTAVARDLFVNNQTGDDRSNGVSAERTGITSGPCRSIGKALRIAEKSDRIVIAKTDEPYRESITLQADRNSGKASRPFVIEGNGAILDGRTEVPTDAWEPVTHSLYRFRPARMAFHLLYLDDKPAVRRTVVDGQSLQETEPTECSLFDRHIYFRTDTGRMPTEYRLTHTVLPAGITLYEVHDVEIRDLVIQGFQVDGVNAHDNAFDVTLTGLTARGNGRSGISVGGASRVTLEACLVGSNGTAQVRTEGESHLRIVNCELLNDSAPALEQGSEDIHREPAEPRQAKLASLPR